METLSSNINNGLDELTYLEYTLSKNGEKAFLIPESRVQIMPEVPLIKQVLRQSSPLV